MVPFLKEKNWGKVMKKNTKSHPIKLDPEEKELLASFEKGEWEPVRNEEKEKKIARKMAARSLSKNVRINYSHV